MPGTERIYVVQRPAQVAVGDEVVYLGYIEVEDSDAFLAQMRRGFIHDWSVDETRGDTDE